ncbi:MAG: DUF4268 domain-containing protein [Polyangiaceae bacterium]|nr:DUF4268 domain-containing protein [Polyangiaceae bacterium]
MPATISDLLQDKAKPVTAKSGEPLKEALARMIEHDYSQLPVVDNDQKPVAMLTADSSTRALNFFEVAPGKLRVLDAMEERIETCMEDDDLLDVLGGLRRSPALLVVDSQKALIGIVTSYDTTEYFRLRAQDIMLVQDVEETVKDYVLAAFRGKEGIFDKAALQAAIEEITPSNETELRGAFRKALILYLELCGDTGKEPKESSGKKTPLNDMHATKAFKEHIYQKDPVQAFDKLTLNEYIVLLLHKSRWKRYQPVFQMDPEPLRRMLNPVRETRNDLAHFRSDISEKQRVELRQCRDWLSRHGDAIEAAFSTGGSAVSEENADVVEIPTAAQPTDAQPPTTPPTPQTATAEFAQVSESPYVGSAKRPEESRYAPLAAWLDNQPVDKDQVIVTFREIEQMIGGDLPTSAREHRAWWGNNAKGHAQSRQWLETGWQVSSVSMRGERVTFARSRQQRYEKFFSALLDDLKKAAPFSIQAPPPSGLTWLTISTLPEAGTKIAFVAVAFSRNHRLRVELYLDTGDQSGTKRIFDALQNKKEEIETELGEPIHWERLDDKRASRVALYYPGSITDNDEQLKALRSRAVAATIRFRPVIAEHLNRALREAETS